MNEIVSFLLYNINL